MICSKVLGKITDSEFGDKEVDYIDVEWDEAFKRRHRKVSRAGEDVGINLDETILKTGLRQDDVLYSDGTKVIAVNIPETQTIKAVVVEEHPEQIAKLCYEVGNTHTTMFRGEDLNTFYIPYNKPLFDKLSHIHGVEVEEVQKAFDFDDALSNSINDHHH